MDRQRKAKYGNKKVKVSLGGKEYGFDSKKEARRFNDLVLLLRAKKISKLVTQPEFELLAPFEHENIKVRGVKYVADFQYEKDGKIIVEDVKSEATKKDKVYVIKKKWFLSIYGTEVIFREV